MNLVVKSAAKKYIPASLETRRLDLEFKRVSSEVYDKIDAEMKC